MFKVLSIFALALSFIQAPAIASICKEKLKSHEEKFKALDTYDIQYEAKEQRLESLSKLENMCKDNAYYVHLYTEALISLKKYDNALSFFDKAIQRKVKPLGNVLYGKASMMIPLSWIRPINLDEIIDLLNEALEQENTVTPLIYLDLSELFLMKGDIAESMKYIEKGNRLAPEIAKFYILAAVIESRRENYKSAYRYYDIAVQKGGENYIYNPSVLLAMTTTFCQLNREDLAQRIINYTFSTIQEAEKFPEYIQAREVAQECSKS